MSDEERAERCYAAFLSRTVRDRRLASLFLCLWEALTMRAIGYADAPDDRRGYRRKVGNDERQG